ncbi:MAG: SRPBCC family protein [Actinomycetota bacterium]|nr:SRPBCC family protein [Actinomycetota bacterium]
MRLTTTRELHFDADRDAVWAAMSRVADFPRWWPWLRRFDGTDLATGSVWSCVIQPPLPYALRVTVTLDEVMAPRLVVATVAGDVSGTARLVLHDDGDGCRGVLSSTLTPDHGIPRLVARVAPAVARFGHDWVLETGVRQFADRAL